MKKILVLLIMFGVIGNDVLPAASPRRSTRIAQMVARRQAAGLPVDEPMVTQAAAEEKKRKRQEEASGVDWAELSAAAGQRRGAVGPAAVEREMSGRTVYDVAVVNNFPDLQAAVESQLRENE